MCSSPRLFAAYHVFHRLPVPGHPPCALLCLTSCIQPAVLDVSDDFLCCRPIQMVLNRTSAGESAAYGLLFFSLACYCFLDLHSCHWIDLILNLSTTRLDVRCVRSDLSIKSVSYSVFKVWTVYIWYIRPWRFARHQHSGSPSWMLIACKAMSFRFE